MALYRIVIPKRFVSGAFTAERPWRNVYTLEADTYDSALAAGDVIAEAEMTFHANTVGVSEITAHLVTEPARRVGKTFFADRQGALAPSGDLLPLWNCVRVDFGDVGVGRPERKYYRPPLFTDQVTGLVLAESLATAVELAATTIGGLINYVGPGGEQHATHRVHSLVQMRQRGWHRRQRPGFVRGYVAL